MNTPTYTGSITIGGTSQTTQSKIGTVFPQHLITEQSGSLVLTCYQADGSTAFDLSSLTDTTVYAKPYGTSETPVSMGTGVVSGAGSNIFTITWTSGTMPAGWSSYAEDRDGAIVLYTVMDETGTADYFSWSTRFNVYDDTFTQDGATLPLVNLVFYDNLVYEYDNTTTDADPGSGKFRFDSTTLASVTEMYIDDLNKSGVDMQTFWQSLVSGTHIYIGTATNQSNAAYFTVSGAVTNGTGYSTVPLTYVAEGTTQFTNGLYMSFMVARTSGVTYGDGESINDTSGNELIEFGVTASAVNHIKTTNAATGTDPKVHTAGGDTNANLIVHGKGTGKFGLADGTDNTKRVLFDASGVTTATDRTLTIPDASGTVYLQGQQLNLSKGADVASAGALTLGTDGNYFDITGTTTITSIGTLGIGTVVTLHFDASLTLTHHATDLILPSGANITTAAGDEFTFVEYASGDWRCIGYVLASGEAVIGGSGNFPTSTDSGDKTSAYTVVSGDVNTTIVVGSATSADFDITLDVSLFSATNEVITVVNESSYIARVVVSNTSTMTINSQYTDRYVSSGQTVTFSGDTATNCRMVAGA